MKYSLAFLLCSFSIYFFSPTQSQARASSLRNADGDVLKIDPVSLIKHRDLIHTCGTLVIGSYGQKAIADNNVMTSFYLIINENIEFDSVLKNLADYQVRILPTLQEGSRYCAIGFKAVTQPEGRFIRTDLVQWVIIAD